MDEIYFISSFFKHIVDKMYTAVAWSFTGRELSKRAGTSLASGILNICRLLTNATFLNPRCSIGQESANVQNARG